MKNKHKHRRYTIAPPVDKTKGELHTHIHVCKGCNDEELCNSPDCKEQPFRDYCDRCTLQFEL